MIELASLSRPGLALTQILLVANTSIIFHQFKQENVCRKFVTDGN